MNADQIKFIHLRETDKNKKQDKAAVLVRFLGNPGAPIPLKSKGGATVAWKVDAQTGDIVVGQAAHCSVKDSFVKRVGREMAQTQLETQTPALVIRRKDYVQIAKDQAANSMRFATITDNAQQTIIAAVQQEIEKDVLNFMKNSWFEELVRSSMIFSNNRVTFLTAEWEGL